MKKIFTRLLLGFFVLLLLAGCAYLGLAYYYRDGFAYGTWINGIYATGKTIKDVNEELITQYEIPSFEVVFWGEDGQKQKTSFDSSKLQTEVSFLVPLKAVKEVQKPLFWGENLFFQKNRVLLPEKTYDLGVASKETDAFLKNLEAMVQGKRQGVFIDKTEEGYRLENTTKKILDTKKAKVFFMESIAAGETLFDLTQTPSYFDLEITPQMQETLELWKKIEKFQSFSFSYQLGTNIEKIDASIICEWIAVDESGKILFDKEKELVLDEDKMKEYILSLASKYDTFNGTREFKTKRGDVVTIEGGTYGNKLNQKKEFTYLREAFLGSENEQNHIPEYEKKALYQGSNDIGGTFIEIDMTNQKMYYDMDGKTVIETDIVTGNMARRMETPARTCFVYAKQKNRILRGPGYASHVNFWMPVNRGIGIHDAKWRKEFGGDIYKKEGSHGCINTPFEIMTELFDMVEIGTPVVMYY